MKFIERPKHVTEPGCFEWEGSFDGLSKQDVKPYEELDTSKAFARRFDEEEH